MRGREGGRRHWKVFFYLQVKNEISLAKSLSLPERVVVVKWNGKITKGMVITEKDTAILAGQQHCDISSEPFVTCVCAAFGHHHFQGRICPQKHFFSSSSDKWGFAPIIVFLKVRRGEKRWEVREVKNKYSPLTSLTSSHLSSILEPRISVFRPFLLLRKSLYWTILTLWTPPSVAHGWTAEDRTFQKLKNINSFFFILWSDSF